MRVLVIDSEDMGLDFCLRCVEAGHDVRLFHDRKSKIGDGFKGVKKVDDWRSSMAWAKDGLILTTGNSKYLKELDRYLDHGFKIFSPTVKSAALEIDRALGIAEMRRVGIEVAEFKTFAGLDEAEAFARKADEPYVFKTLGDEADKSLSYVSSDPADLVGWIQRKKALGLKLKGPCILQKKIEIIAEVGVSGWFGPDGFLPNKWQICFEHKKLMDGENGPNTGEMGTVCQYVKSDPMAEDMLEPMAPLLKKLGHRGDFAIGCGIDAKGKAWPFEFTVRCGWPAFFIQTASHKGDPAQWMRDLLDGEDTLDVSRDVAIGVVCAQPRWPYADSKPETVEGAPISGIEEVRDQIHPAQMMMGTGPVMEDGKVVDKPVHQTAGELVFVATGLGGTVSKAREAAYDAVKATGFPDRMVREDIGLKLEKPLPKLHGFGFAKSMEF